MARMVKSALVVALLLGLGVRADAELRISDLEVYLNDHDLTVHVVALGAIPPTFLESLQSGIPAHLRFTVELWQYQRLWRDRLLTRHVFERQLAYNIVTREYKVTFLKGDTRPSHTSRDLRDAQRVLSEVRGAKLLAASKLDPADVVYVRVRAETALGGENTILARLAGTAEETVRRSDYRTLMRDQ
jgi:hypothetical protein